MDELTEEYRALLLNRARETWGKLADEHGLGIVDADEVKITVELREGPVRPGYQISKLVLRTIHDANWVFEEAARRLKWRA